VHAFSKRWRGLLGTLLATGTIAGFAAVAAAPSAHAAFPGTNGPVVFIEHSFPTKNLDTLNPNTGVVTVLCTQSACGLNPFGIDRPSVSANGQTVVFSNTTGIATIPITGGGITQVTTDKGFEPSFTPDGATIVYENSSFTLTKVPAAGGASTAISGAEPGCVDESEVSPNGATVAYINTCGGVNKVETIPIGGGLPNVVVSDTGQDEQVSWSPDGTHLAIVDTTRCPASTPIGIVLATANNGAPTCLPNSTTGDIDPSFSPDGTKVVVRTTPGDNAAVLNANGIGRTNLTIAPVAFGENDWAPAVNGGGGTTTTTTTPCAGTLSGNAFKGGSAKAKKALAGVVVSAGSSSSTTNSTGAYSITVPCGTVTKTATGPDTKTRVCHFGDKKGPTSNTVTVTNGSNDIENLFCKKK